MATHPTRVIEHAVRGMLPHNRLGAKLRRHLKVYVGPEHPHQAQTGGAPKKPKVAVAEKPTAPAAEAGSRRRRAGRRRGAGREPEPEAAAEAVAETTPRPLRKSQAVPEAPVEASSEADA